jgi:hypothetical protein
MAPAEISLIDIYCSFGPLLCLQLLILMLVLFFPWLATALFEHARTRPGRREELTRQPKRSARGASGPDGPRWTTTVQNLSRSPRRLAPD